MTVQSLINQSKLQEAVKTGNEFFKNRKTSTNAKLAIAGSISKTLGSPHERISIFKEAVASANDVRERALLRLALASAFADLAQIDNALSLYKDVYSECPDDLKPECMFGIAKCLEALKNEKEAMEYYRKLSTTFPKSNLVPESQLRLAILTLYERPDSDEPREILQKLEKDSRAGRDIHANAVFYLSYMEFVKGSYSKAAEGFRRTAIDGAYDPSIVFLSKEYLLWSLTSIKLTSECEKLLSELSASNDKSSTLNPDLLILLGGKFYDKGKPAEAEKCYSLLLKNTDNDIKIKGYISLASLMQKKGELDNALKNLRDAEKVMTQDKALQAELLSYLGTALLAKGERNEAVLVFEKCIEMSSSKNAAARARLGLGRMLADANEDLARANRYAMSVFILSDDPELSQQAIILSMDISIRQNKLDEAKTTYSELKKRFPELLKDEKVRKLAEKIK